MMKKPLMPAATLVLLAVFFAALTVLSAKLFSGARLDLTQDKLYTLSQGTRNILEGLDEPVKLYRFFSEEPSRELPQIRSYAKRVDELLGEMVDRSNGKLSVQRIDPVAFSEQEDEAARFGLQAVPIGASGITLYLGIAGTNSLDEVQTMPFLQPQKEQFLEYDLAKMISSLGKPEKKTIGVLSSLEMQGGFDPAAQSVTDPWVIREQLSQLFTLQDIDPQTEGIPKEIDLLVLIHPRDLPEPMLYSIDQFVLAGGRLVAFMDPVAESDQGTPGDPMAQMQRGSPSTLGKLLAAWGVDFDVNRVLGDLQFGIGSGQNRHIGILSVPPEGLNTDDIISADLEVVNFSSVGWLQPIEGAGTSFEVLAQSSENAAPLDASRLRFLTNPADLMQDFNPTGERYALAARVTGPAASAFEQAPEVEAEPEGETEPEAETENESAGHIKAATAQGINVVLYADTDMLTDRLWVQKQPFLGQVIVNSFADNGNIVVNSVDNLLGDVDLISIRTRASSSRPFERVDALQLKAEESYRATEERLQLELAETEARLTELQSARGEEDLLVLTDEQQAEVQRFMDRKLEIRKELRQVQHDLQSDIDSLGTRLKLFNIALVPVLVILLAAFFGWRRRALQNQSSAGVKAA
ncbi:MAG: Gldg family protein [Xanthomonadales bacterium]|nr:Gldg family protein [Xanthomonadales bacterium]